MHGVDIFKVRQIFHKSSQTLWCDSLTGPLDAHIWGCNLEGTLGRTLGVNLFGSTCFRFCIYFLAALMKDKLWIKRLNCCCLSFFRTWQLFSKALKGSLFDRWTFHQMSADLWMLSCIMGWQIRTNSCLLFEPIVVCL